MTEQRSLAWLQTATVDQLDKALKAGELAEVLAGRDPGTALSAEQIAAMTPAEIVGASKTNPQLAHRIGQGADQGARGPQRTSILDGKTAEQTLEMLRRGDLDTLLRGET